jgi:hypothetical protein
VGNSYINAGLEPLFRPAIRWNVHHSVAGAPVSRTLRFFEASQAREFPAAGFRLRQDRARELADFGAVSGAERAGRYLLSVPSPPGFLTDTPKQVATPR